MSTRRLASANSACEPWNTVCGWKSTAPDCSCRLAADSSCTMTHVDRVEVRQLVARGVLAPVGGVLDHHGLLLGVVRLEHEGAGADGFLTKLPA